MTTTYSRPTPSRQPALSLPVASALLVCVGLAMQLGVPGTVGELSIFALISGALLLLVPLRERAVAAYRAGLGPWLVLLGIGAVLWNPFPGERDGIPIKDSLEAAVALALPLLALGGVLVVRQLRDRRTPWQLLSGHAPAGPRRWLRIFGPLTVGIGLMLLGAWTSVGAIDQMGTPELFIGVLLAGVGIGFIERLLRERVHQQQHVAVAAHLHDSVLQDLAVIQRQADDPDAVRSTARAAERGLRDWLAGRESTTDGTLAAALRHVCRQVEDEHPGSTIDVVTVRDAALDDRDRALIDATREALRNAVRHGGGTANVFAETGPDGATTVYVRDTGPGFDQEVVPNERRGVRDSIIGRMESVGGTAEIDSSSEGTEVTLRLPSPEPSA